MRLPNERGISYSVVTMCHALASAGARVELLAPNCRIPREMKNETIWHYHDFRKNSFKFTRLPFIDLPIPHLFYLILNWSFTISAVVYLLAKRAKVVHLFNDARELLVALRFLSWIYKPMVVFELHIRPTDLYNRFLEKLALSRVDLLLVTTNQFKSHYANHGFEKEKILVFPNGINTEDYDYKSSRVNLRKELGLPQQAFIVGYAGRFTTMGEEKGIPELIQATALLSKKIKNIFLVCVGGSEEDLEKERITSEKHGLSPDRVILIGDTPRKTLYKYMRAFDVSAMPFPWSKHYAYNMSPLKMFEYMAAKNPIIASNLPSVKEVLIDSFNSLLTKPGDYRNLASKIEILFKQPTLGKKLAEQAFLEVSTKYTWIKRGMAELEFLQNLQKQ